MALHMQKLSVGTESIESLRAWQTGLAARRGREGRQALPDHITRMTPKRKDELLKNGSIYWVIKGQIQCRNRIVDLEQCRTADGRKACRIVLDPELIAVLPTPKRPFQGWRYLQEDDAPSDIASVGDAENLPAEFRAKLVELGVW